MDHFSQRSGDMLSTQPFPTQSILSFHLKAKGISCLFEGGLENHLGKLKFAISCKYVFYSNVFCQELNLLGMTHLLLAEDVPKCINTRELINTTALLWSKLHEYLIENAWWISCMIMQKNIWEWLQLLHELSLFSPISFNLHQSQYCRLTSAVSPIMSIVDTCQHFKKCVTLYVCYLCVCVYLTIFTGAFGEINWKVLGE